MIKVFTATASKHTENTKFFKIIFFQKNTKNKLHCSLFNNKSVNCGLEHDGNPKLKYMFLFLAHNFLFF